MNPVASVSSLGLMVCGFLTIPMICLALLLLIRGMPTYREGCDLDEGQLRLASSAGVALLLIVALIWVVLMLGRAS